MELLIQDVAGRHAGKLDEQPNSEPADYKQFKPGDKVRTVTGEVRTVWQQRGYQVFVAEETDQSLVSRRSAYFRLKPP